MSNELLHLKIEKSKEVTFVLIAFNESNGILDCISSILNQNIDHRLPIERKAEA